MLIKACLNGARAPGEHPALPLTPAQLAADGAAAVAAGAQALHIHPRDAAGRETLAVDDAVRAVQAASPGVPVGVSTGAWIVPDVSARVAAVRAWRAPAMASVNLSEDGIAAPRVHHGYGPATWEVLRRAKGLGHGWRVGFEDVLVLPDGRPPASNAELISAALAL
jgi:uncharacterized protein (DUF849 family)